MIRYAHVIVDLQAGDTGKGKVAHHLCKSGDYNRVVRYNGGGNAGHTIYHEGKKYVTHFIPVGVIYGIKSIIGPGCVVNPFTLEEEIKMLEAGGFDVRNNLFIDERVHVITPGNVQEDSKDTAIGTTKTGNGPTYRNKYGRTGLRAKDCEELQHMLIDIYEDFHSSEHVSILFEGAQGFELDIDWGDYPYVTSSHCTVGGAVLNGVPPRCIHKTYGVAKAYRTYVGAKEFEKPSRLFDAIREIGGEFGATTGRPRQIDWLCVEDLIKACNINGVTHLVVNKVDVLDQVGHFKMFHEGVLKSFDSLEEFENFLTLRLKERAIGLQVVKFSNTPHGI